MSSSAPSEDGAFTVAVLGRPNVGKSTLFNRLVGRQRAITDPTPGVTRDVLEGELDLGGVQVRLLDTGGYTLERGDLEREVSRRSLAIAASSDLALVLVEVAGLTREDRELFGRLRRLADFPRKVVLVVNKVDSPKQELGLGEFQALGFDRLAFVSAAHGRGIGELKRMILSSLRSLQGDAEDQTPAEADIPPASRRPGGRVSPPGAAAGTRPGAQAGEEAARKAPAGTELRLAIIGKPNTGKSTLLNRLLGEERALVAESPGTTRDPVGGTLRYRGRTLRILDTAGIRRKNRVSEAVEYYSVNRAIHSIEEADLVVLLMDVREGVSEQDKKIASLAVRAGRGVVLALNKIDLLEGGKGGAKAGLRATEQKVRFFFPMLDFAPLVPLSAASGQGVERLLAEVLAVGGQLHRQVSTGRLNQAVKRWVAEYALPVRGKNVKIRYATQTGANPVRFLFFVNSLRLFPALYIKYLKNRVRADLGFGKVPVDISLRES